MTVLPTFSCGTRHPFRDPWSWSIRSICSFWKCWKPGKKSNESEGIAFARYLIVCLDYDCDDATASFIWAFPYPISIGTCDQTYCTKPDSASSPVGIHEMKSREDGVARLWKLHYGLRLHNWLFPDEGGRRRRLVADALSAFQADAADRCHRRIDTFTRLRNIPR